MAIANPSSSASVGLTGKQKVALMLKSAGYSDERIGHELGISRENANRLLQRARKSKREFLAAVAEFVEEGTLPGEGEGEAILARRTLALPAA